MAPSPTEPPPGSRSTRSAASTALVAQGFVIGLSFRIAKMSLWTGLLFISFSLPF